MARRIDVIACKPEELFLAVAQVEQQLSRLSVKGPNGRKNIPIQVFCTMSEHNIPDTNHGWKDHCASSEFGINLLSSYKTHREDRGILPGFLPTFRRYSYSLPNDTEMFMNGVLIDVYAQQWKSFV